MVLHTRALLTAVLEVERELELLPEVTLGAGSHLQGSREFSESKSAYTQN